ncbi:MAG: hypothetical protein V4463_03635 [Pseudomonadota bacterium]
MKTLSRAPLATVLGCLFLLAAALMVWLGVDAHAYFLPAVALLVAAALQWRGGGQRWLRRLLLWNQFTGLVLVLDLWLGDALHLPKLDISAAMLLANLVLGGPLMSVLALPALAFLHFGPKDAS